MSFDLKILDGDIDIGSNGDVKSARNYELAKQSLFKILLTPIGENVYHPGYGSNLSFVSDSGTLDAAGTIRMVRDSVYSSISNLIALQQQQQTRQFLSPEERIVSIKNVDVQVDQTDPRLLNIFVEIVTGKLEVSSESVTIRLR